MSRTTEPTAAQRWLDETTRWGQVNFNEHDVATFDVEFWRSYWRTARLQGITVTVGGPLAYYPSLIPHHRRSAFDEGRDLFGQTVAAAREDGLRVLARLDPTVMSPEIFREHPDWVERDARGLPRGHESVRPSREDPQRHEPEIAYVACYNGGYFSDYIPAIMGEVMENYDVDGFFTNAWPKLGLIAPSLETMCWCTRCRSLWDEAVPGGAYPTTSDAADHAWRAYVSFVQDRVEQVQSMLRTTVTKVQPEGSFVSTAYPSAGSGLRWDKWIHLVDALFSDAQSRRNPKQPGVAAPALWEVGLAGEFHRAVSRGKPVVHYIGAYLCHHYRHAALPATELMLEFAEASAHGERPKWHVLGGDQPDRRWLPTVADLGGWMQRLEPDLRTRESVADVAVVWSPRSVQLDEWSHESRADHGLALMGWYRAFLGARIPVDLVHEDLEDLSRYRVVVVPSGTALSARALSRLADFRDDGGRIVVAGDALARTEWGELADRRAIRAVVGAVPQSRVLGPFEHAYVAFAAGHRPLGETATAPAGRWMLPYDVPAEADVRASLIADYPLHPTHASYPAADQDGIPVVFDTDRATIVTMDLDAQYARLGIPDYANLLIGLVREALGDDVLSVLEGDGLVDFRLWRRDSTMTAWLVNLDTPALNGGYAESLRPLGPQKMSVRLPPGARVASVGMSNGDSPAWDQHDGRVNVTVPSVAVVEAVRITLERE